MERNDIKEKIIDILDRLFSDSGVDRDILGYVDLIDDLGMDSVTFISFIIDIEVLFGIAVPDDELLMDNFREADDIVELVANEIKRKNSKKKCDDETESGQ